MCQTQLSLNIQDGLLNKKGSPEDENCFGLKWSSHYYFNACFATSVDFY